MKYGDLKFDLNLGPLRFSVVISRPWSRDSSALEFILSRSRSRDLKSKVSVLVSRPKRSWQQHCWDSIFGDEMRFENWEKDLNQPGGVGFLCTCVRSCRFSQSYQIWHENRTHMGSAWKIVRGRPICYPRDRGSMLESLNVDGRYGL